MTDLSDQSLGLPEQVAATLKALGVASEFLPGLLVDGDDWSFVIKSHALVEAALIHLLVEDLGRPELGDTIGHLETSNVRIGKLAFLKALKLLDANLRTFIQSLSELRNALIHEVRNVDFSFAAHSKDGDSAKTKKLRATATKCASQAGRCVTSPIRIHGKPLTGDQIARGYPRVAIYIALNLVLAHAHVELGGGNSLVGALMRMDRRKPDTQPHPTSQQVPQDD